MVTSRVEVVDRSEGSKLYSRIVAAAKAEQPTVRLDNGNDVSLEASIAELSDVEIGCFFTELSALFLSLMKEATTRADKAQVRHRFRRLFGIRYSCLLLTSVIPDESDAGEVSDAVLKSARAAVEESLQWHSDAVLAHVLIYYGDGSAEELMHECAVVEETSADPSRVRLQLNQFSFALKEYVRQYGSSVRTKEHLRLARISLESRGPSENGVTTPALDSPKIVMINSDQLQLPPLKADVQGDQAKYKQIVWENLGQVLRLNKQFETIHYSAGSDAIGEANVRATAHLYLVFRREMKDLIALDYILAMRETLARLTITFFLDRMRKTNQALVYANRALADLRVQEQLRHKDFEDHVKTLSREVRGLQETTDKVMNLITPSVWTSLKDWIGVIRDLSDFQNQEKVSLGKRIDVGRSHEWTVEHWGMALLKLVNATDDDISSDINRPSDAWRFLSGRILQQAQDGHRIHPIWRCLNRMGIPMGDAFSVESLARVFCAETPETTTRPEGILRRGLVEPSKTRVFDVNGFTGLFLLFALGAEYEQDIHAALCDRKMVLVKPLDASAVVDGLNLLHDTMNRKEFCGVRSVRLRLSLGAKPVLEVGINDPDLGKNFDKVCQRMEAIKKDSPEVHPGTTSRNTSMAVFAALGLNERSWQDALPGIEIDTSQFLVVRKNPAFQSVAASFVGDSEGIRISYGISG
jgi:hypothetical protein